jgi:hypothetical protein
LAGCWRLTLGEEGASENSDVVRGSLTAQLPGSLAAQRIGEPVTLKTSWTGTIFDRSFFDAPEFAALREPGHLKLPFWLQPETVFVGEAWYECEFELQATWLGKRVELFLERPHWVTRVWLDGREIGSRDGLSVPHIYELGAGLAPGSHRVRICVDNRVRIEIGENAHSVSDHTQGNWNGIIGRIELRATEPVWIGDVAVTPRVASRSIVVSGSICGELAKTWMDVTLAVPGCSAGEVTVGADESGTFLAEVALHQDTALWDEFTPVLHTLIVSLANGERREVRFGLREIAVENGGMVLNGRPIFLRGALDCCVFPLTGHPPMDVAEWRRILGTIKAHGLNHVRFHSWCPPEAAFEAGDELGVYFQVEAATWPNAVAVLAFNSPAGIGDGKVVDAWTLAEAERIARVYGNHPCFMLMASGNEPGGPHHREYLARWVTHMRAFDGRRLYTGAAGWPEIPENQFHVASEPRGHQWGDGLKSRMNALPPATTADYRATVASRTAPVIAHEIGQWCAYPPVYDVERYGGHLRAKNYEVIAASLAAKGLGHRAREFAAASGKLQALCYKEEIESALRTSGFGGFQLLGLQDFPGQGTAPVGVLDHFWESKGAISSEEYRRFCNAVVPLVRLMRRVFTTDDLLEATVELAQYGPAGPMAVNAVWRLVDDAGFALLSGRLGPRVIPSGVCESLGQISIPLRHVPAPARYRLEVLLEGTPYANDWDVWVYPVVTTVAEPTTVVVTSSPDEARAGLENGQTVLLSVLPKHVKGDVALGFTPIFWNTWCTQRQAPHTLGVLCDPTHAALAQFPTEAHSNWQWWHVIHHTGAMILDDLPQELDPIISVIDDWATNRRLGIAFEARVGVGRLIVCSVEIEADDPVVRQLRRSLLSYLTRSSTGTPVTLTWGQVAALIRQD